MQLYNITPVILTMNDEFWLPYCLESLAGHFNRYVIYDVGSTDRTKDVIDWFAQKEKKRADLFIRYLPFVPPVVQGAFRNSMIAESEAEWYFIVDADEVYKPKALRNIIQAVDGRDDKKPYGIVRRLEIVEELTQAYGLDTFLSHHRVYHRTAYWHGSHPGEVAVIPQKPANEFTIADAICYHFHNTNRSTKDSEVPKRIERRSQATYHRGELALLEVVKELPLLLQRFEDFPVNPSLQLIHAKM